MKKSTAPALQRLRDHLFRVTNEVIAEVESGLHSGSPEAVAEARENTLREICPCFRYVPLCKGEYLRLA